MTSRALITATLDPTTVSKIPCDICRNLLVPLAFIHRIDLAIDGERDFLQFTPQPTSQQLTALSAHRDCLLTTIITMTTRQFFVIEHRHDDDTWYPFDYRCISWAQAKDAWGTLIQQLAASPVPNRATWLAAGIPIAHYPT
jgi:hypothetical protein